MDLKIDRTKDCHPKTYSTHLTGCSKTVSPPRDKDWHSGMDPRGLIFKDSPYKLNNVIFEGIGH